MEMGQEHAVERERALSTPAEESGADGQHLQTERQQLSFFLTGQGVVPNKDQF